MMMYKTDVELLPAPVLVAIENLRRALLDDTDYLHVQLTLDNFRNSDFRPMLHVIVDDDGDGETLSMDKGN